MVVKNTKMRFFLVGLAGRYPPWVTGARPIEKKTKNKTIKPNPLEQKSDPLDFSRPTSGETQPWVSMAGHGSANQRTQPLVSSFDEGAIVFLYSLSFFSISFSFYLVYLGLLHFGAIA
jgi:hypothetical protein